ncbi:ROK family protein [bacterium]|nr:ROK family protein [bacterium]
MRYEADHRIVMTLDAGGTNLVFSAIQGNREIVTPVTCSSSTTSVEKFFSKIQDGFRTVLSGLPENPSAISFAFPGPADYKNGIIGDPPNMPAFRGGVPLGPMLRECFRCPVFINNDGNLFAYGEAVSGLLPKINRLLSDSGNDRRYATIFGATLGTGLGGGFVCNGSLFRGDNDAASEIWMMHRSNVQDCAAPGNRTDFYAEETVSARGIRNIYAAILGIPVDEAPAPETIYKIAAGDNSEADTGGFMDGSTAEKTAARQAFVRFGKALGGTLAAVLTIADGLIVLGGGLSLAYPLFLPAAVEEMNRSIVLSDGSCVPRTELSVFNLENPGQLNDFLQPDYRRIRVPGTSRIIEYDPCKKTGIGISVLGTSRAIALGSYVFALHMLDNEM